MSSPIPLYLGGLAFSSSCSWVFTYSVGKVMQISMPPAIPPEKHRKGEQMFINIKNIKNSHT